MTESSSRAWPRIFSRVSPGEASAHARAYALRWRHWSSREMAAANTRDRLADFGSTISFMATSFARRAGGVASRCGGGRGQWPERVQQHLVVHGLAEIRTCAIGQAARAVGGGVVA